MKLRDALDSIVPDPSAAQVYGQPYQTPDGATVLPVGTSSRRPKPRAWSRSSRRANRHVLRDLCGADGSFEIEPHGLANRLRAIKKHIQ